MEAAYWKYGFFFWRQLGRLISSLTKSSFSVFEGRVQCISDDIKLLKSQKIETKNCISSSKWILWLIWKIWNHIKYSCVYIRGAYDKFPDFFVWAFSLIVHTWNSSPLRSNLLRLQYTCCTVPITSGRPHWSPLVWVCQWPSSQPLSSPQLSHADSLWA